jgi:hypothetical protein
MVCFGGRCVNTRVVHVCALIPFVAGIHWSVCHVALRRCNSAKIPSQMGNSRVHDRKCGLLRHVCAGAGLPLADGVTCGCRRLTIVFGDI